MTWKSSSNQDYNRFSIEFKLKKDIEVDVPELLQDIKPIIHAKILEIVKCHQQYLHYGTYKIIMQYYKTEKM